MLSTWCNIELVEIPSIDCRDPTQRLPFLPMRLSETVITWRAICKLLDRVNRRRGWRFGYVIEAGPRRVFERLWKMGDSYSPRPEFARFAYPPLFPLPASALVFPSSRNTLSFIATRITARV